MDDFIALALPWLLLIAVVGCAGGLPLLLAYLHREPRRSEPRPQPDDETADRSG